MRLAAYGRRLGQKSGFGYCQLQTGNWKLAAYGRVACADGREAVRASGIFSVSPVVPQTKESHGQPSIAAMFDRADL